MLFTSHQLPYQQTGVFTKIVLDYIEGAPELQPFYSYRPTLEGVRQAIEQRQHRSVDRALLVDVLQKQYEATNRSEKVDSNIRLLLEGNTFTICTAHQPNLLSGPLYFIYKILHAIKLADILKEQLPDFNFVPVFYMGSEDADLAELNHFYVEGKKYEWRTTQTGSVGRMKVDDLLIQLINELEGQLSAFPNGQEVLTMIRKCYQKGITIQHATFELVNMLFGDYGVVVLIPDNADLKRCMLPIFKDDLFHQAPGTIVAEASEQLSEYYDAQAYPREINLFYLQEDKRERIVKANDRFVVQNMELSFSAEEIEKELADHPERFSPNVILRGLYQEAILPNIAFIGGGGELAYWLQLKALFDHYQTSFPVLVLRNSFLLIESKWKQRIDRLGFSLENIFQPEPVLLNYLVKRTSEHNLSLNGSFSMAENVYEEIRQQAMAVDATLGPHVAAIKAQSLKLLKELEKKMLRAEKRKFAAEERHIKAVREQLFPGNGLQERHDNITYWYAAYGKELIKELYEHSLGLEQEFTILLNDK